jgi:hypothetical protein
VAARWRRVVSGGDLLPVERTTAGAAEAFAVGGVAMFFCSVGPNRVRMRIFPDVRAQRRIAVPAQLNTHCARNKKRGSCDSPAR